MAPLVPLLNRYGVVVSELGNEQRATVEVSESCSANRLGLPQT